MHRSPLALLTAASLTLLPATALAEDMRVIIDRFADSVEVFISLPAEAVPGTLGGSTDGLMTPDGRFEIGVFRKTGTAVEGDAVFGDTRLRVAGAPVGVDAMSVMVHPEDLPLPLETPIDGVAAMSVCTVPDRDVAPRLEDLRLYGGFIAWPVDGFAPVALELRNAAPIEVWLGHFAGGEKVSETTLSLPAQAFIALPAYRGGVAERYLAGGGIVIAALLAALAAAAVTRARLKRAREIS